MQTNDCWLVLKWYRQTIILQIIYFIFTYKHDLVFNNLQGSICHKTDLTQTNLFFFKFMIFCTYNILFCTFNIFWSYQPGKIWLHASVQVEESSWRSVLRAAMWHRRKKDRSLDSLLCSLRESYDHPQSVQVNSTATVRL